MKNILFTLLLLITATGVFGQTDLLPGGFKGVDAGSDSTFLKVNGFAVGKRPTDNVYKNGTLGLRTTDTSAYLNMQWPANSTKPLNQWNYGDASTNAFNFIKLKSTGQTDNPNVADWNFWVTNFPGNNTPFSTRANNVMRFGYNVGSGGGRVNPLDADLHIAFESNYNFQQPALNLPIGARVWEWHLQSQDTLGIVHRPITAFGAHNGRAGGIGFSADQLYLEKYNSPGTQWINIDRFTKNFDILDSMQFRFNKNGRGGGGVFQMNAAGTSYLDVIYTDNLDRVVNGGTGVTATFMPHGVLEMAGLGVIKNPTGNTITLGTDTQGATVDMNSNNTTILRMSNGAQPTRVWTHFLNSDNYVFTSHTGNSLMQLYDNGAILTSSNNKMGVGTDTRGRFTIQQITNTGQGGLMFVPVSASEMYQQVNSSSEMAFTSAGGQERVTISQAGVITSKTSIAPTTENYVLSNNTGASKLFRSNATPEGTITANTGDLVLSSISSSGGLWGKYSGTGTNTGWGKFLNLIDPNSATSGQVLAWNGTSWAAATNTSESTSIGAFNNTGNSNGLSLTGSALSLHAATISTPGAVNVGQQTFSSGADTKIFTGTGSRQLTVDGDTDNTAAGISFTQLGGTDEIAYISANSSDASNGAMRILLEEGAALTEYINIGTANDTKGIFERGGLYETVTTVTTTPYTIAYGDRNVYLNGTSITVNLQGIGGSAGQTKIGRVIYLFNDNATSVTVTPNGSDTINDAASLTLSANTGVTLLAVATNIWVTRD